ncbi:alpha/beta fold hydrolase [Patescibacteria group bacterium]
MKNLRTYGKPPFNIVAIHGGPGAPGEMAPVARHLSKECGVLEPIQTENSVDGQVQELKLVIENNAKHPVVLIGWSWGAWLSYILTAKYPKLVKKLILVSSGPFEARYAKRIMKTRMSRLSKEERDELDSLFTSLNNLKGKKQEKAFSKIGKLIDKADSYSSIPHKSEVTKTQPEIYEPVWDEASKLREEGKLLALGKQIRCPVVAIHGDYDPHPAEGIKKPLAETIKNFRLILIKRCGHHPWYEKYAKDNFYEFLTKEIS